MSPSRILWLSKLAARGTQTAKTLSDPRFSSVAEHVENNFGSKEEAINAARHVPFTSVTIPKWPGPRPIGTATLEAGFARQAKRNLLAAILKTRR